MIYRHILFLLLLIADAYRIFRKVLIAKQQRKPLPKEVQDIYSPEKYEEFLARERDYTPLFIAGLIVHILLNAFCIYSPFYRWMEKAGRGNVYLIMAVTVLVSAFVSFVFQLPRSYYADFVIDEKYKLNHKTKKEFFKDELIDLFTEIITALPVYALIIFVIEKLPEWTGNFHITYLQSFGLVALILIAAFAAVFGISLLGYFIQRKQYTYTDLEEGELRDKIMALTEGSKKKIRRIEVYSESKKSNRKNAYMLRILWYRAFGIADNYLDGNSERELLAVLAHEAGHLRHKRGLPEYLQILPAAVFAVWFILFLPNANAASISTDGLNEAFGLTQNSYVLVFSFVSAVLTPLFFLISVYNNYVSRRNETEADMNAVKEGYGKELIDTFRQMSSDELIDVNPAPLIVFCEDSHPAIVTRIRDIENAMNEAA